MIFVREIECNLNYRQGDISMAPNFKIFTFKTSDSLYLKWDGDFDGNSAYELLNTLKKNGEGFYQIFINTDGLKDIHHFGKEVLEKKLGAFKNQFYDIIFVGRNWRENTTGWM
jgi:hypothetical protein